MEIINLSNGPAFQGRWPHEQSEFFIIFIKNDIKSVNNEKIKPTVKNKKT